MKPWINAFLALSFTLTNGVNAANYYFSSSLGNDSATSIQAQSMLTPWKTLTKLNSFMNSLQPGDSVLLKRGDVFYGSIIVTKSGNPITPIVLSAYGSGAKPIISGLSPLNNWTNVSTNTWEADCPACGTAVNMVLINEAAQGMGRYPNITDPEKGYLSFESHQGNTQITDNQLPASPDWTGAEVVIRKVNWIIDRNIIQQHSGNTIQYSPSSPYLPIDNWGYFIQNHPETLDQFGEWYYNSNKNKLLVFTGSVNPSSMLIQASSVNTLVIINNQTNITVDNISFKGSNNSGLGVVSCQSIHISNCNFNFSGVDGIRISASSSVLFENKTINHTNNNGIMLNTCTNVSIRNNKIKNTAIIPGMGQSQDGNYNAIQSEAGADNIIENNIIDSTGYIPITFGGDGILIKNNFISNYVISKHDGGGIYTWPGPVTNSKTSKIIGNIVLNAIGAPEGTFPKGSFFCGIYLDNNANNIEVVGNSVSNCGHGIFLHGAHEIKLEHNTSYNNDNAQFFIQYDNINPIRNVIMNGNIYFSRLAPQLVAGFNTSANDIQNFGVFDSNYYCRPLDDDFIIKGNNQMFDLTNWKINFALDPNTKKSPLAIPSYKLNNLVGSNLFPNGDFNSYIGNTYSWSPNGNNQTIWNNGPLDGGCVKHFFSPATNPANPASLMYLTDPIDTAKNYILKFSLLGTKNNRYLDFLMRQTSAPYTPRTPHYYCHLNTTRTENEFLITHPSSENFAQIIYTSTESDSTLWMDNLKLYEANVTMTNPDDYIRFEYNATQLPKTITLSDSYIDVKNNPYVGSLTLQPFTSIILLKKFPLTTINYLQRSNYDFLVYPNPGSEYIMIELANPVQESCKIELINMLGQKIFVENLQTGTLSRKINTISVPTGAYTLLLSNNNNVAIKKIMVVR